MLFLDTQYIACGCAGCEAKVCEGHDRPIFGLSHWERHAGSRCKKWRCSLRVEPGTCGEVPAGGAPMPVGAWLSQRGVVLKASGG